MPTSFTIRPQPKSGESLTSFLSRVAARNSTQLKDILRMLDVTSNELRRRDYYRLDIVPGRHVDLELLSELTGVNTLVLSSLTYGPLLEKFYDDEESESINEKTLLRDLDIRHRRFCPLCLKENGFYQLLWQVKDIHICTIHKLELVNRCQNCGRPQPYAAKTLAGFLCNWCGQNLSLQSAPSNFDSGTLEEQRELLNSWTFIHQSDGQFIQKLSGRSLTKSFIIKLLYIATGQADSWDRSKVTGLGGVSPFLHYVNDNEKGYPPKISTLLNLLRSRNMHPQHLLTITVKDSFVSTNLEVMTPKEPGVCYAPWCSFHGSNTGMKPPRPFSNGVPSVGYRHFHERRGIRYTLACICVGCYMEYGYDPTSKWVAVRPDIEWVNIIRSCLVDGLSYEYIRKKYAIGMNAIKRLVGYIVANELLPQSQNDILKPTSLSDKELIRHFRLIHAHDAKGESKSAWDLFGWTRTQFYYYRSLDVIQRWHLLGEVNQEIHNTGEDLVEPKSDPFMDKLTDVIQKMKQTGDRISIEEISRRLDASFLHNLTVKSAPYLAYIKKEISLQKSVLQELSVQKWWNRAKEFVASKQAAHSVVYVKDVLEHIGVSESTVKRNSPQLNEWIKEISSLSRQQQLQSMIEECLARIELATDQLISMNQSASIQDILKYAEVPDYIGYYYPVILEALHGAKKRIQRNNELPSVKISTQ